MNTMEWLAVMIILIIIEIATTGFGTIWFAIGALAAVIVSVLGFGTVPQVVSFLLVSFATLIFTRPYAVKYVNSAHEKTNYESLIGATVRITEDVDNTKETGAASANGTEWTVRAADNSCKIAAGELARVVEIRGVKLIVKGMEES